MSDREIVLDLVNRMPTDSTLKDIAREIDFVAGVREGFEQLDRGEGKPAEEVKRMIDSWIAK